MMVEMVDLIITARWVVPVIPRHTVLEHHAIVIQQGVIIAIQPADTVFDHYQANTIRHHDQHCVMPGLINNHTHAAMSLFRGFADDLPLMTWLNDHIWPAEQRWLSDGFVEAGSELAIAEMIRSGTTCFNDMYFFPEATARAVDRTGIRANLGMVIIDFPTGYASDALDYLHKGQLLHDHYRQHTRITTSYAPHAPYTVSDDTLSAIAINAEEMDVPIHMHIHETAGEIQQSLETFSVRPLERLHRLNILSPRLTAVHMTQVSDNEMRLCADSGLHIAHCPESNLKLASGFAPVSQFIEHNINVSIGTDGVASNNDVDMFAEMRQSALLAKAVSQDASSVPAHIALEMATINAAKALNLDNDIGSIEVGKSADLIAIDFDELNCQPCYDVISQLVYAVNSHQVSDVWVAGKPLLQSGQHTTLNRHHLIEQTQLWADKIRLEK